jgi:predicted  nucleic acid-binding Zn-ribbon protein
MKPIQVRCTGCGKVYAVANANAVGKSTKCKQCGATFLITPMEEAAKRAPAKAGVAAGGKPPAAAPPKPAPAASQEDDEDDGDYPDTEPTISVSAYEAQKLREQLRKGLAGPEAPASGDGVEDGDTPSAEHIAAAARGPANPRPVKKAAGPSPIIWIMVGALVVIAVGLAVVYFMMKP